MQEIADGYARTPTSQNLQRNVEATRVTGDNRMNAAQPGPSEQ